MPNKYCCAGETGAIQTNKQKVVQTMKADIANWPIITRLELSLLCDTTLNTTLFETDARPMDAYPAVRERKTLRISSSLYFTV